MLAELYVLKADRKENSDGPDRVACLNTDTCLAANVRVASSIQAQSKTFEEIDH